MDSMMETYYAGSYWLARHESAEACARRAERFFRLLGSCDPAWNRWHDTADSEKAQTPQLHPDAATFTRMFARKENRQGEGGFRFWLWVGDSVEEAASVNVRCGAASPWLASACALDLPSRGVIADRVLTANVMAELVRAMA